MSSFDVKIHQLTVHPHPNADALELAQVGGYRAVVAKGAYRTGDYALYIPEAAVLPDPLIEELGLTGRLAGTHKNRVKAIKLRGELSQGIVCRPEVMASVFGKIGFKAPELIAEDILAPDWAEDLGIVKYEPPIPAHLVGEVYSYPWFVPMFSIENIKKFPDTFTPGQEVIATEKIHGTNVGITFVAATGHMAVASKGMGAKGLALVESDTNTYWRAVKAVKLREGLEYLVRQFPYIQTIAVYGEVFGAGIQDLPYGFKGSDGPQLRIFDIKIEGDDMPFFTSWEMLHVLVGHMADAGCTAQVVPVIYRGPYDYDTIQELTEGNSAFNPEQIREGLVVRSAVEGITADGRREYAKFISSRYLLRGKKGEEPTEFE